MLTNEQTQILEQAIFLLLRLRNDQSIDNWETERARKFGEPNHRALFNYKEDDERKSDCNEISELSEGKSILKFTNKELKQMPNELAKILKKDLGKHIRIKANGVYEIRLNYNGKQFYGCSKNFNEAKRRFIESIINYGNASEEVKEPQTVDIEVAEYAIKYLEAFKKPNISEKGYRNYTNATKNHIEPNFKGVKMSEITATACQKVLNALKAAGKGRTAEDVKSILSWICSAAFADGILRTNPMLLVKIKKHKRKTGKQIPVGIMESFLSVPPKNRYECCMWLIAYSGVRPCELKDLVFGSDGFMTVKNAKARPDDDPTYRRIPIHSALLPHLENIKLAISTHTEVLSQQFRKRFPKEYRLYDLRHTFTSRIQECYATKQWVDYATWHTENANTTDRVYTHWSDTFQVSEMEKLNYKSQEQSQNGPDKQ